MAEFQTNGVGIIQKQFNEALGRCFFSLLVLHRKLKARLLDKVNSLTHTAYQLVCTNEYSTRSWSDLVACLSGTATYLCQVASYKTINAVMEMRGFQMYKRKCVGM